MVNGIADIWISILKNNYRMLGLDETKPRGIVILGILIGLGAISQLFMAITGTNAYFLGHSLNMPLSTTVYIFYAVVSVVLAYGMIGLKRSALYLSIPWFLWGTGNGIMIYVVIGNIEMLADAALSFIFLAHILSRREYFVN